MSHRGMKILVVGSGGREHALVKKLGTSIYEPQLFCTPGNAGIAEDAECLDSDMSNDAVLNLATKHEIDLCIVGPEVPLVAGLVDELAAAGIRAFGPSAKAAKLEGSKAFSKAFMQRHNIPTAAFERFDDVNAALAYLRTCDYPTVVKDSDLAAGKGVTIAQTQEEAQAAVSAILSGNGELIIEDFLTGQEVSFLLFSDGKEYKPMLIAQDYKQAYEGDTGPMTGGMGTVCPAPLLSEAQHDYVCKSIVEPTLQGLQDEGAAFKGVLFIGLMVNEAGVKVLEYNVRFGDPETQVVLPLLKTDLIDIFDAVIDETLKDVKLDWSDEAAACVVMAAPGYPQSYEKGIGLELPSLPPNVEILHAGTARRGAELISSGGRVLNVRASAPTLEEALDEVYKTVKLVNFPGAQFRKDIGKRF